MAGTGPDHISGEDIVAYRDGYLTGKRLERVSTHLAACPGCRRRVEEFDEVGRLLREAYPPVDDPEARARIVALSREGLQARAADPTGQSAGGARGLGGYVRRLLAKVRTRAGR